MAATNMESIAASMRNCSLDGGRGAAPPHQPGAAAATENKETGNLFYTKWKSGERRTEVSRITASGLPASYYSSEDYSSDDAGEIEDEEDNDGDVEDCSFLAGGGTDHEDFFGVNSRNSHSSSSADSRAGGENGGAGGLILVVVGCRSCFMYFMVPKRVEACPKCGGSLLHFN